MECNCTADKIRNQMLLRCPKFHWDSLRQTCQLMGFFFALPWLIILIPAMLHDHEDWYKDLCSSTFSYIFSNSADWNSPTCWAKFQQISAFILNRNMTSTKRTQSWILVLWCWSTIPSATFMCLGTAMGCSQEVSPLARFFQFSRWIRSRYLESHCPLFTRLVYSS